MECSLSTWPSISQYDDLSWMGLANINSVSPERSLDLPSQFEEFSFSYPEGWSRAFPTLQSLSNDSSFQISSSRRDNADGLAPPGLLASLRCESINAEDFTSALNFLPPCNDTSAKVNGDMYDTCDERVNVEAAEFEEASNAFMPESVSELSDVNSNVLLISDRKGSSNVGVDSANNASLLNSVEDVMKVDNVVYDSASLSSTSRSPVVSSVQTAMQDPSTRTNQDNAQLAYLDARGDGAAIEMVQPSGVCIAFHSSMINGCLDVNENNVLSQHHVPKSMVAWNEVQTGDKHPTVLSQQDRMAAITFELKRSRAQASRARRRAASKRRIRKSSVQKLIRMSSQPINTRERRGPSMPTPASMSQKSSHSDFHSQQACLPPCIYDGKPHLNPIQQVAADTSTVKTISSKPETCHLDFEDTCISSDSSSSSQSKKGNQNVNRSSLVSSLATSHMVSANQTLDAVLLSQLQSVLNKMDLHTRLCLRDAFFRLARNAKYRQSRSESAFVFPSSSSHSGMEEAETNLVDRWIVNMLFSKQPANLKTHFKTHSSQTHNSAREKSDINDKVQQWSTCGGSLTLDGQPVYSVVKGL